MKNYQITLKEIKFPDHIISDHEKTHWLLSNGFFFHSDDIDYNNNLISYFPNNINELIFCDYDRKFYQIISNKKINFNSIINKNDNLVLKISTDQDVLKTINKLIESVDYRKILLKNDFSLINIKNNQEIWSWKHNSNLEVNIKNTKFSIVSMRYSILVFGELSVLSDNIDEVIVTINDNV